MENKARSARISGSGTIAEGVYDSVKIAGSGRADGAIKANSVHVSGSGSFQDVEAGDFHVSGSGKVDGNLVCTEAHVSGSCTVSGDADVQSLHTSGSLSVSGDVRGTEGKVSGSITVKRGVEFEQLGIYGSAHIGGLVNAEKLTIAIGGNSEIGAIGGSDIEIKRGETHFNLLGLLFGQRRFMSVKCALIEGTNVSLENTICETIRGKNIIIGSGCEIGKVEYTDTLEISDEAEVGERIKTGA